MLKRLICLGFMLLLTACAMDILEKNLNHNLGKDINSIFKILGYPDQKYSINDKDIYVWQNSYNQTVVLPNTSSSYGHIGYTPFSMQTSSYNNVTYNYRCSIKIITNKQGVIDTWELSGNDGGCSKYADRFDRHNDAIRTENDNHQYLIIKRIQSLLKERNIYAGEIDGKNSDELEMAIKKYQEDNKMIVTGTPDIHLLKDLTLSPD